MPSSRTILNNGQSKVSYCSASTGVGLIEWPRSRPKVDSVLMFVMRSSPRFFEEHQHIDVTIFMFFTPGDRAV